MRRDQEREQEKLYAETRRKTSVISISNYDNNILGIYPNTRLFIFDDTIAEEYTVTATYNKQVSETKFNVILSRSQS